MPRSRWTTLLNLETIKARNKPKEAPKAPERAPFFLPTLPGVDTRFDFGVSAAGDKGKESNGGTAPEKRKLDFATGASIETEFVRRMMAEKRDGSCASPSFAAATRRSPLD